MQKVRLTISKPSREYDSTLIFKYLLEVLNVLRNINCIHNIFSCEKSHICKIRYSDKYPLKRIIKYSEEYIKKIHIRHHA